MRGKEGHHRPDRGYEQDAGKPESRQQENRGEDGETAMKGPSRLGGAIGGTGGAKSRRWDRAVTAGSGDVRSAARCRGSGGWPGE